MSVIVWFCLGIVAAAFVPGTEFVAVALIWGGLALTGVYWIGGNTAEQFVPLSLVALGFLMLFLRRRAARWL